MNRVINRNTHAPTFTKCEEFDQLISLNALPDVDDCNYIILQKEAHIKEPHISEAIKNSSKIIRTSRDSLEL